MAKVLDEANHYFEMVHWEPENPYQLEAFSLTLFTYIAPDQNIHIVGRAVFSPEGYDSIQDIVGDNDADQMSSPEMIHAMIGGRAVAEQHGTKWFELRSARPIPWQNERERQKALSDYQHMKDNVPGALARRLNVVLKEPQTLFLNCNATEAEQKIKASQKPWLDFASGL